MSLLSVNLGWLSAGFGFGACIWAFCFGIRFLRGMAFVGVSSVE